MLHFHVTELVSVTTSLGAQIKPVIIYTVHMADKTMAGWSTDIQRGYRYCYRRNLTRSSGAVFGNVSIPTPTLCGLINWSEVKSGKHAGKLFSFMLKVFFSALSVYIAISEDIQQLCWRSLLMACRRYSQWYISYLSSATTDWCLAPYRWRFYTTHGDAPQSVGLLWTSGQLVAETFTWQHTTLTTERHPCSRRDSNTQSQQVCGRSPTP